MGLPAKESTAVAWRNFHRCCSHGLYKKSQITLTVSGGCDGRLRLLGCTFFLVLEGVPTMMPISSTCIPITIMVVMFTPSP